MSTSDEISRLVRDDGCVACIGVFDGVHLGHRALLDVARARATTAGLPLIAVTFDPHPLSVVRPGLEPTSLATMQRREDLLRWAGADGVHVLKFDHDMATMAPLQFVEDVLVGVLNVKDVVVGENFRFGHRAAGTVETLRDEGERLGFTVSPVTLAGDGQTRWSSTYVRRTIESGDMSASALALGRAYSLEGIVVHGDHRGRGLGFPTANLSWPDNPTVPADGVYAGWVVIDAVRMPAAISVGSNPQFQGAERRVEAYVLDRDDLDLYDRRIEVEFIARIRGQETFPDLASFIARMNTDVEAARDLLVLRRP
jgi:riboflavin kinase / FMN adenylyltransferase